MFVVKFSCKDGKIEEYFYHKYSDAKYHLDLFEDDDSDLYERIEIIEIE